MVRHNLVTKHTSWDRTWGLPYCTGFGGGGRDSHKDWATWVGMMYSHFFSIGKFLLTLDINII